MKGKRIQWRGIVRHVSMPGDLLCFGDQAKGSSRQYRHVQGLADVAGRFRAAGVMMEDGSTGREIQQRHARKHCQRATRRLRPEKGHL
jgi:hypothetical protein